MDLLPSILRLRTEGRGPKTEFPLHGIGQFVRQDPQVRHVSHDPVRFGQMNDPFLTRLAVGHLLRLAKDIRPDQLLDRALVGDDQVARGVFHVHQAIADTGRLDVVATRALADRVSPAAGQRAAGGSVRQHILPRHEHPFPSGPGQQVDDLLGKRAGI